MVSFHVKIFTRRGVYFLPRMGLGPNAINLTAVLSTPSRYKLDRSLQAFQLGIKFAGKHSYESPHLGLARCLT